MQLRMRSSAQRSQKTGSGAIIHGHPAPWDSMTSPTRSFIARLGVLLALAGCGHSEPFVAPGIEQQGPFSTVPRARLTFNSDADYGATWTADGKGILYTFYENGRRDRDRCLAILPAEGGTRLFKLCDDRPGHSDSAETIASAALSTDGELLYLVGSGRTIDQVPQKVTLFHADTASPFTRRVVISLPSDVGGGLRPNWLLDVNWTGPDEFIAMAANLTLIPQCVGCALRDTIFEPLGVVRGTIGGNGTAMELLAGTEGAASYSLADGGTNVVFVKGLSIYKMPRAGGPTTLLTTLPNTGFVKRIDDVTCRGTACAVGVFELTNPPPPASSNNTWTLMRISTAGGPASLIETTDAGPWSGARVSPINGDVVIRVGSLKTGDLYLFRNLLP